MERKNTMNKRVKILMYKEILENLEKHKNDDNVLGTFIKSSVGKPGEVSTVIIRTIIDSNINNDVSSEKQILNNNLSVHTNSLDWFTGEAWLSEPHYDGLVRSIIIYDPKGYLRNLVEYVMNNPRLIKKQPMGSYFNQDNDFNNWFVKKIKCPYSYIDNIEKIKRLEMQ